MVGNYSMIRHIKEYAKENNIPIMVDDGIDFLTTLVLKKKATNILEIGTAIGYSAIMMALVDPKVRVTSIERDEVRYLEALKNIKAFELEDRITLIYNDAFHVKLDDKYDLIFIDAAKAQNIKFFEMFEHNLKSGGIIVTDNLKFHGLVAQEEDTIKSKNLRGLVRKIKEYISFLKSNTKYDTEFFDIGDGISVSTKK
ncbi:MAG TPA: O-methyltransferase [Candidatus Faecimonas gallistercoris]|nr:O-methyltransferase [Candidatus Faecimonas gallistercoris]